MSVKDKILNLLNSKNLAESLDKDTLDFISKKVSLHYQLDKQSREVWDKVNREALSIAKQEFNIKNYPWDNASNVKYPLITIGCIMYAAHAYPLLIRNGRLVEFKVLGKDSTGEKQRKATRLSEHMSYQMLNQNSEWQIEQDKLSHVLALLGHVFKKVYYDPVLRRNRSQLCLPDKVYVNNNISSLESARRITHEIVVCKNEIIERIRCGYFLDIPLDEFLETREEEENSIDYEGIVLLEQHTYLDLDEDGYEEPYIIVQHKQSEKILGIYPRYDMNSIHFNEVEKIKRIDPISYFVDYIFMPSPDGTYYGMGLGSLLYSINNAINTLSNQIIDSGTLYNLQAGFVNKGFKIKNGSLKLKMGEYQVLDFGPMETNVSSQFYSPPVHEPSSVLFQLLGMLIDAGKELAFINEMSTGQQDAQNVPATTAVILANNGYKLFSAIQRRIYIALTKEFKIWAYLNKVYLDESEYFIFNDDPNVILKKDYEDTSLDVIPVADPTMSSDAERLMQAQALIQLKNEPEVNSQEVVKRYLETLKVPNIELILKESEKQQPDINILKLQFESQKHQDEMKLAQLDKQLELEKLKLEYIKLEQDAKEHGENLKLDAIKTGAEVERMRVDAITDLHYASIDGKRLDNERLEVNLKQNQSESKNRVVSNSK